MMQGMNQIFSVVESAIDLLVLGRMIKEKKTQGIGSESWLLFLIRVLKILAENDLRTKI